MKKRKESFTLLEISITAVILAVALTAFVQVLIAGTSLAGSMHRAQLAANGLQDKMEEIANSNLGLIMNYNNTTFAVEGLTPPTGFASVGTVSVNQVSGTTNLYTVVVTAHWQASQGRSMESSLQATFVQK